MLFYILFVITDFICVNAQIYINMKWAKMGRVQLM